MVHAIKVAKTDEEYDKIERETEEDPRKVSDLYLDRYGAQPILPVFLIPEDKFEKEVLGSDKLVAAELFNNDSIMCMLKSIPIKELFADFNIKYRKVEASDELVKKYGVADLPALLFFKGGKILGKVEGYFETTAKKELKDKIAKILN